MLAEKLASDRSAETMLRAAVEAACAEGLAGIGPRALSRIAGLPPATVNYRFGSGAQLSRAIYRALSLEVEAEFEALFARIAAYPERSGSAAGVVASLVGFADRRQLGRALFMRECDMQPWSVGDDGSLAAERRETRKRLWHRLSETLAPELDPADWWLFAEGAEEFSILLTGDALDCAWVADLARRLADRLGGREIAPIRPTAVRSGAQVLSPPEEIAPTKQRIIDAAIALLLRNEPLTHRSVAQEGGTSLAATTYHFRSKSEILVAAMSQAFRLILAPAAADDRTDLGMGQPFDAEGRLFPQFGLLRTLAVNASRDASLAPLVDAIVRQRGRASYQFMLRSGFEGVDPLDGLLWSVMGSGVINSAEGLPAGERNIWVARMARSLESRLFPR